MDIKEYLHSWDTLKVEAKFSRVTILCQTVIILILLVCVLNKDTLVTMIPYSLTEQAYLSSDKASANLKESWGYMIATELGNITQKDYDFVQERLKSLVSPTIYSDFFKKLREEITEMKTDNVTISFTPTLVAYEPSTDKVFVFGKSEITNSLNRHEVRPRTYEMRFAVRQYAMQLTHFASYAGEPKDQNILRKIRHEEEIRAQKEKLKREREAGR